MKKILTLIGVAAIWLATVQTWAQGIYSAQSLIASNSATCAATAGTNIGVVIDCRKQAKVALQLELMADASGAYTFTIPVQYSLDGTTFAGMASSSIAISFNGVTKQTVVTNIDSQGAGYLKIPYLTNATAAINVTNIVASYGIKIQAP